MLTRMTLLWPITGRVRKDRLLTRFHTEAAVLGLAPVPGERIKIRHRVGHVSAVAVCTETTEDTPVPSDRSEHRSQKETP